MNKQELIERIKRLDESYLKTEFVLKLIEQLDEPGKVKIPQFVADWYEEHKKEFYLKLHKLAWELVENLNEDCFVPEKALDSDFKRWYHKNETAIQTLVNMHQFGYEVEETKYVVTDGNHLYFKGYQEDVDIVILADEQPGTMDYVKKFDTKEKAQEVANILGWKVQEVE